MKFISLVITLAIVGCAFSVPLSDKESAPTKTVSISKDKLRQGDGDDGDGVGEIEAVGEQVSQIISGVLSGNFGQIFKGSTSFIEDTDTETGVDTILTSVALPLNTLLTQGVQQGQKYYNITTPGPSTVSPPSTQAALIANNPLPQNIVHTITQNGQQQQIILEPVVVKTRPASNPQIVPVVTAAPAVPEVGDATLNKSGDEEDEDAENESDATLRKQ